MCCESTRFIEYCELGTDRFRGVDFDDPEYGFKEEDKPSQKVTISPYLRTHAKIHPRKETRRH